MSLSISNPNIVFHLVHGTFDSHAEWCKQESLMQCELRRHFPQCVFSIFNWTGFNTHVHRWKASRDFSKIFRDFQMRYPNALHVVIGHSHGGMVALYSLCDIDPSPNIALVTMGTPFLDAHARNTRWKTGPILVGICLAIILSFLHITLDVFKVNINTTFEYILISIVLCVLLHSAYWIRESIEDRIERKRKKILDKFHMHNKRMEINTLCLYTKKDEALMGLHFSLLWPIFASWVFRFYFYGVLIIVIFCIIASTRTVGEFYLESWKSSVLIVMGVCLCVLIFIPTATTKSGMFRGFAGWQSPLITLSCQFHTSRFPSCIATSHLIAKNCKLSSINNSGGKKRFRHSSFMNDRHVVTAISDWILALTKTR